MQIYRQQRVSLYKENSMERVYLAKESAFAFVILIFLLRILNDMSVEKFTPGTVPEIRHVPSN